MAKTDLKKSNLGKTGLTGIGAGILKGVGNTTRNFFELASDAASVANLPGQAAEFITKGKIQAPKVGAGGMFDSSSKLGKFTKKELQPNTPAQKVGFFAEQVGEFFLPSALGTNVAKIALKASTAPDILKILGRAGIEGAESGLVTAVQSQGNLRQTGFNSAIGAGVPLAQGALSKIPGSQAVVKYLTEKIPADRLNKILRPRDVEFSFGRNPGLSVVQEPDVLGVLRGPLSRGQLLTSIAKAKERVGEEIGRELTKMGNQVIDLTPAVLAPIDEALQKAARTGEQGLVDRILTLRNSLTNEFKLVDGKLVPSAVRNLSVNPKTAQELKTELGQNTRWTGQAFDNDINKVRVSIYRKIDEAIDKVAPATKNLNARYGGLLTAEKALERRNTQLQRLVSFGLRSSAFGGLAGAASYLSGNSPIESALTGLGASAGVNALNSVAVQSRVAKSLNKLAPKEREALFGLVPTLRNIYLQLRVENKGNQTPDNEAAD